MSEYEDYDRASAAYSKIRVPVGLEILLGIYTRHLENLKESTLLDLGCGSGTYALPLTRWFGTVHGVDISRGQITEAQAKCAGVDNVDFRVGDARQLHFEDSSVDGVLLSLMLHHVPSDADSWRGHRAVLAECARVLRPGGVMVLGVCSQQQVYDGAWYCRLMPRASEVLAARHPRPELLTALAQDYGFYAGGQFVPVDEVLQGSGYFDGRGPLREEWRKADSIFSLLTDEELRALEARVHEMEDAGTLDAFVRQHDEVRRSIGQVTFMAFVRGKSDV